LVSVHQSLLEGKLNPGKFTFLNGEEVIDI
jgi:hypothetical protein